MPQELPEGTVTVLFTDVEGSTDLTTRRGDEAAQNLLRGQRELVREQVEQHSGHEVKTMGDGFMVAFASARRAVACAVDIQRALDQHARRHRDEEPLVRIGLNSGEVIQEEADLFGAAVNAAARIAAKAKGGQILVSETVRALLGPTKDVEFVERGRFRLKGFPERWRLYEVPWQEENTVAAPALAERTPFVGRETERAELRRLLEQTVAGQGAMAMIGGEPGVGKTRLAEELIAEARQRGMTALIGHCYEMEGAAPYIPFVEMTEAAARRFSPEAMRDALGESAPEVAKLMPELRRLFPDISQPPELPPEQERRYLFNGMREFIARAGRAQPLLLVLDDLHWADDSTMLLVQHIAQQLHEMPVLVLGTYRDVELDIARPLARTLEALLRQRLAHRIALKRLPQGGVAAMLRALSGQEPPAALVDAVFSETEGNPFFVEEVFHHFAEEGRLFDARGRWRAGLEVSELDVPEGVRLVIGRRLERVGEECRRVLTTAAVIGRGFSFELLEALGDVDPDVLLDAVDDAERAQLITAAEGDHQARFTFAHELIRQTLMSALSLPRRQRIHLRIAAALEQTHARNLDEHAADLAYHFYQAGAAADPEKTVNYLALAGQQSFAAAAFEDALRHYEEALSLQPPDDRKARVDLLYKRGHALRSVGRWEEALSDWREALDVYERLGEAKAVARLSHDTAWLLAWSGLPSEAVEVSRRGLRATEGQVSADRCHLLASAGGTLSFAGDHAAAESHLAQALAMADGLSDQRLQGEVLMSKASHHWNHFESDKQADAGLRAAELLRSTGDLWMLADALWISGGALLFLGRLNEVVETCDELEKLAERLGHLGAFMTSGRWRGLREFLFTADIDMLEAFARRDLELCLNADMPWVSHSYSWLGLVNFWRGEWEQAGESFQEAVQREPPGVWGGADWAGLFLCNAYRGDGERALAMLDEKREELPSTVQANSIGAWTMLDCVVEGLAVLNRRYQAAKLYPLTLGYLNTGSLVRVFGRGLTETVAGIAAAAAEEWDSAEGHYRSALRQAEVVPHRLEQAEVRRWHGRMLIDRDAPGDRDQARGFLTEAIDMYRKIGMPKHVEMAKAMLAET